MPNWAGHSRKRADYRFLAIREPLRQLPLGDAAQLPFPTPEFASKGTYKPFGVVTNQRRRRSARLYRKIARSSRLPWMWKIASLRKIS